MDLAVAESAAQTTATPELHDRLIAATAHLLGLSLITNDSVIAASPFITTV